jgi:hypothetical protein
MISVHGTRIGRYGKGQTISLARPTSRLIIEWTAQL